MSRGREKFETPEKIRNFVFHAGKGHHRQPGRPRPAGKLRRTGTGGACTAVRRSRRGRRVAHCHRVRRTGAGHRTGQGAHASGPAFRLSGQYHPGGKEIPGERRLPRILAAVRPRNALWGTPRLVRLAGDREQTGPHRQGGSGIHCQKTLAQVLLRRVSGDDHLACRKDESHSGQQTAQTHRRACRKHPDPAHYRRPFGHPAYDRLAHPADRPAPDLRTGHRPRIGRTLPGFACSRRKCRAKRTREHGTRPQTVARGRTRRYLSGDVRPVRPLGFHGQEKTVCSNGPTAWPPFPGSSKNNSCNTAARYSAKD